MLQFGRLLKMKVNSWNSLADFIARTLFGLVFLSTGIMIFFAQRTGIFCSFPLCCQRFDFCDKFTTFSFLTLRYQNISWHLLHTQTHTFTQNSAIATRILNKKFWVRKFLLIFNLKLWVLEHMLHRNIKSIKIRIRCPCLDLSISLSQHILNE